MTLHTDLPIYKTGCDLVKLAFAVQQQMPRSFKRTLGEKITTHCTELLDLMALANASRGAERAEYIRTLLQRQHATTVLLRVCFDMRFISHSHHDRTLIANVLRDRGHAVAGARAQRARLIEPDIATLHYGNSEKPEFRLTLRRSGGVLKERIE